MGYPYLSRLYRFIGYLSIGIILIKDGIDIREMVGWLEESY